MSVNGKAPVDFGEHTLHHVHLHDHRGQDPERRAAADWCSGKYLCATCADKDEFPKGTWFSGPRCVRPGKTAAKGSA